MTVAAAAELVSRARAGDTRSTARLLSVVENDELVGIVSIGDLVKARIDLLESEREQLQSYIAS